MPLIQLSTKIDAPLERVFDLARSIDAHTASAQGSSEKAIAGRTSGLIEAGETITWEAIHFGIRQRLTVEISSLDRPHSFTDRMVSGAFASMKHVHRFSPECNGTLMSDDFEFSAPLGILGRAAERLFLTRYMTKFLTNRNRILKKLAESEDWQHFLSQEVNLCEGDDSNVPTSVT